ncbi:T9SS type A sorting domain-containing protein [Candidatus Kryptobacter tengchongensis]|nr:T9SS type A sorting domain-containing protein [Candidatus Kryptobacter tengchongensis]CUS86650.1 Por secretion system C-terminal sorting domain-containing protein [Candidatus Kryptobacter tengchongensis]
MRNVILFLVFGFIASYISFGQTSPDYIFGSNNAGSGWSWTTGTQGQTSLGGSYKWQFQATADANEYFKFGETSSPDPGQGFWYVGSGGDVQYPGGGSYGDKWTAYYHANMGDAGAFYFAAQNGRYYVIKSKIRSDGNADFAIFDNGTQEPVTITAISPSFSGGNLFVDVTLSGSKSSQEKVWVRYTTDNWATSNTVEASTNTGGNTWRAQVYSYSGSGTVIVEYYAFTTINLMNAPQESDADFFTINFINNNGQNYKATLISGNYYIGSAGTGPGNSNPDFSSLRSAVDFINSSTIAGNCTFYFTSDLTESENSFLGVNTNGYTLTFRPYYDQPTTIKFTKSTDNASSSGGWIIGLSSDNWNAYVPSHNIVIEGTAPGGSEKRLTIQARVSDGAHDNTNPIVMLGDCDNSVIRNCKIIYQTQNPTLHKANAILVQLYTGVSPHGVPDNVTIENCDITATGWSARGIYLYYTGSGSPENMAENFVVRNCKITAEQAGIELRYAGNSECYGNEIYIDQTETESISYGIYAGGRDPGKRIKIYSNKILQLRTANSATTNPLWYGIVGIFITGVGNFEIYNNFITGFELTASSPRGQIIGISVGYAATVGITANVYNNTVVVNNVTNPGGTPHTDYIISAFHLNYSGTSGTRIADVRNNVFITNEIGAESQCFYWEFTNRATLTTDYNLFYFSDADNGYVGRTSETEGANGTNRKTLSDWKSALQGMSNVTGKDANSVSKAVTFKFSTDLHLWGLSFYDKDLLGVPISGITKDIDGEDRHSTAPYKGADEVVPRPVVSASKVFDGGGVSISPGAQNVPMLGVNFAVSTGWANMAGLSVQKFVNVSGRTLAGDGEVTLKAYVDNNENNQVDANDTYLGSASFSSDVATLNFSTERMVNAGVPLRILLALDVSSSADPSHWVALKINAPEDVVVNSVAEKSSDNYPIKNDNDVSLPVQVVNVSAEVVGNIVKLRIKTQVEREDFLGFNIYRGRGDENYILVGSYQSEASLRAKGNGAFGGDYEFVDKKLTESGRYYYKIEAVARDERKDIGVVQVLVESPKRYVLYQNYPNPFNPYTTIKFELPVASSVKLELYNSDGQKIKDLFVGELPAGYHKVKVDGRDLSSGIYFYILRAGGFVDVRKMVLVK